MDTQHRHSALARAFAAGLALCPGLGAAPALADGQFAQLDLATSGVSAVATAIHERTAFGANYSTYESGDTLMLSVTYAFPLGDHGTFRVGPTLGRVREEGSEPDLELGVKASWERWTATSYGSLYLLIEANSVDRNWFGLIQTGFSNNVSFELSAGGSDSYRDMTVAISQRLDGSPVSLRAGYRLVSNEAFLGISINTF